MKTTNQGVISAWKIGLSARNSRGTLYTDGERLYSYQLHVGTRLKSGATVLGDFTAGADGYHSQTTSCHIGLAKRGGVDLVMHPVVWSTSPMSREAEIPF